MTNASKVNTFAVLSVVIVASVLAFGAFAKIAHAQDENIGYFDMDGSPSYVESIDTTYPGEWPSYTDSIDTTYPGEWPSYTDSIDTTYPGEWPSYTESIDTLYDEQCGCNYDYEEGVGYSEREYGYEESWASQGSKGSSGGSSNRGFSAPSMPSFQSFAPRPTPSYPVSYPVQQQQQQQQQQQHGGSQPINIVNNNNNTNNNNNVVTVVPVAQAPVTYPIQYTYPQPVAHPFCTITLSNYANGYGSYGNQLATLSWSSSFGTSAYITPNVGTVAPNGSMTVYPTYSTVYTMTVTGPGGTATCQTQNYAPAAPYVSLSQIPYTGFDFGTFGNAMYWLSLIAFAAAGAYLAVYYMPSLALAGIRSKKVAIAAPKPVAAVKAEVSPIQVADLPVVRSVSARMGTSDSMSIAHEDGTPRIVITRS